MITSYGNYTLTIIINNITLCLKTWNDDDYGWHSVGSLSVEGSKINYDTVDWVKTDLIDCLCWPILDGYFVQAVLRKEFLAT